MSTGTIEHRDLQQYLAALRSGLLRLRDDPVERWSWDHSIQRIVDHLAERGSDVSGAG